MSFLDKINLLHLFMIMLFTIGLLLIITSFNAFSKIGNCNSGSLKTKLRWAIGIGTTFFTLALGYGVCIYKAGNTCSFGKRANWKIYMMLAALMGMGICLLVLTFGIKDELKKPGCNIDLGGAPDILTVLAFAQIFVPALYIGWIIYSGNPQGSKRDDEEEDSDEYASIKAESERSAINKRRKSRYRKIISSKEKQLSQVQDNIEQSKSRNKNPNQKDLSKEEQLIREISQANKSMKAIGTGSSTGSSSVTSTPGGYGGGGGGGGGGWGSFKLPGLDSDDDDDDDLP
jgi:hypothetical protein